MREILLPRTKAYEFSSTSYGTRGGEERTFGKRLRHPADTIASCPVRAKVDDGLDEYLRRFDTG
jgi:hypothetical protein